MAKQFSVKVLKDLGKFKAGQTVKVTASDPVWGHYWRRRLKDAARDGCCELVTAVAPKQSAKKKPLED